MNKFTEFIRKEKIYIWMGVFIIFVNILLVIPKDVKRIAERRKRALNIVSIEGEKSKSAEEDLFLRRKKLETMLVKNKRLAMLFSLASLLILLVLFLGILIDALLITFKLARKNLDISTFRLDRIRWDLFDIARVVILFLFFGYLLVIIESFLSLIFPILKKENFVMMLNSSILDMLSTVFILYFTVVKYKETLISLGLSIKNLFKNVFYGIVGYVATVPILIGILIIISFVLNITKYVPERQPVVELFLREENVTFLVYTSIFASIIGPFIEELFFRGFMYNALKKSIGIFWATLSTSAVFAGLHTNVVGFLPIMALGILLAHLYEKTGTLVSSITVHVIHNLVMVFFVFLLKQVGMYV